ncbi:hypothetical protein Trydic_g2606 [Trypoxylus dichotomus]
MEELLIEKVKQRELLFNTRSRDYKDQIKRCEAWEAIGKELNMSGDFAKDAWERLRRCYTNALHRRRFKKTTKRIFPWKFEKEMSFLLPFLELRKSRHDNSYFAFDDNPDVTIDDELHIKEDVENGDIDPQDNLVETLRTHFMDQTELDRHCENSDRREASPNDMEQSQRYIESYPYVKPIYQQMCSIPPVVEGLDETDMFYLSMSRMTKRLPKLEQAKIKLLLSSTGPCLYGEEFQLDPSKKKGICACKKGYIRYTGNSRCYRPYTQGPCPAGQMLTNETTCDIQPCKRGELYFPKESSCFRIGSKGPCRSGQVVTFDFETRPSLDGISYNGLCRCVKTKPCDREDEKESCTRHDQVLFKDKCYKLYTQGPCSKGAWLTPVRHRKEDIWTEEVDRRTGACDCMPGYTKNLRTVNEKVVVECLSPSVILADYLNKNYVSFNETEIAFR